MNLINIEIFKIIKLFCLKYNYNVSISSKIFYTDMFIYKICLSFEICEIDEITNCANNNFDLQLMILNVIQQHYESYINAKTDYIFYKKQYTLKKEIYKIIINNNKLNNYDKYIVSDKINLIFIKDIFIQHLLNSVIFKYYVYEEHLLYLYKKIYNFIEKEKIANNYKINMIFNTICLIKPSFKINIYENNFKYFIKQKLNHIKFLLQFKQEICLNDRSNIFCQQQIDNFQFDFYKMQKEPRNNTKHGIINCCIITLVCICFSLFGYLLYKRYNKKIN